MASAIEQHILPAIHTHTHYGKCGVTLPRQIDARDEMLTWLNRTTEENKDGGQRLAEASTYQ